MAGKGDYLNSVIGPGSIFEGKFYISGSLKIDGKFEGEIKTEDALVVGESGKMKTNISARSVVVAGTMIGNITADEEIRLEKTGKVMGDMTTPVLHVTPGVIAQGHITITGGQKKDVQKIID
ncbi:MAG: polymer-forming cytoskeletal protein, partial [Spirochaetia bacterium]|nr:polymer-forming cytoskeletal protein [Spirochaetia bacterium]